MHEPVDMKSMLADYMESGFLENIIDMVKHDRKLFDVLGHLISDERGRVRLGTVALFEEMRVQYPDEIAKAIPAIAAGLKSPNPTVRADAAYLLGIIGNSIAVPYLSETLKDGNSLVRDVAGDSIASCQTEFDS